LVGEKAGNSAPSSTATTSPPGEIAGDTELVFTESRGRLVFLRMVASSYLHLCIFLPVKRANKWPSGYYVGSPPAKAVSLERVKRVVRCIVPREICGVLVYKVCMRGTLLRTRSFVVAAALGAALLGVAGPAAAQGDEQRAGARTLATEGAQAFNEGRFKDAVDLFGKAESLVHAPPHLLFMARAYTKLGQYVKAREAYLKIVKEQLPANAPQAFRDALDHDLTRWPWMRARVRLEYGRWLAGGDRRAEAGGHLRAAREVFARIGARRWDERAATALAGLGQGPHDEPGTGRGREP
jgi:hypothetical protein